MISQRIINKILVDYQERKKIYDSGFTKVNKEVSDIQETLNSLSNTVSLEIKNAMRKGLDKIKYELTNSGSTNAAEVKHLRDELDEKVSMGELRSMLSFKWNIQDIDTNMKATDILHKQIKHLSVMIVEILRNETAKYEQNQDSEQAKRNKYTMMLYQWLNIAQWIQRFNPENLNTNDLKVPEELQKYHSLIENSFKEINENTQLVNKGWL